MAHTDIGRQKLLRLQMRDLAEAADRIKFAKGQGLAQEAERPLAAVRALVPALEARLRPAVAAKRYLERRLGAPILEMTTAETLAFLRGHPHGGELLPVVRDLAEAADRIKFAKGQGLAQEAERHLAAVRALVPALEARLRPPAPAAAEGKAA